MKSLASRLSTSSMVFLTAFDCLADCFDDCLADYLHVCLFVRPADSLNKATLVDSEINENLSYRVQMQM